MRECPAEKRASDGVSGSGIRPKRVFTVSPLVAVRNIAMPSKKPDGRNVAGPRWRRNGFGSARESQPRAAATEARMYSAGRRSRVTRRTREFTWNEILIQL